MAVWQAEKAGVDQQADGLTWLQVDRILQPAPDATVILLTPPLHPYRTTY